ncbi:3'-5' exonuclease [Photobacterium sagamiensis]|uniref:3'-5' exonuclease n=1 Tax=Photobacterium sagamiensis TaxID=2910241 RepID=UPI003D128389
MIKWLKSHLGPLDKIKISREKQINESSIPNILAPIFEHQLPDKYEKLENLTYLAVDIETTGLNPLVDSILSIGWVEVESMKIDLQTAKHIYISASEKVKRETAVINHIVPETLHNGVSIDDAMEEVFKNVAGKILIAHGATIEKRFINHYIMTKLGFNSLPLLWLDTMRIERSMLAYQQSDKDLDDVRLITLREKYGLPEYPSHNALIDALAAAELFLAQTKMVFGHNKTDIESIFKRSI